MKESGRSTPRGIPLGMAALVLWQAPPPGVSPNRAIFVSTKPPIGRIRRAAVSTRAQPIGAFPVDSSHRSKTASCRSAAHIPSKSGCIRQPEFSTVLAAMAFPPRKEE